MDNRQDKAQTVVEMSTFKADTGFSALAQVEAYWEALRGTRLMPKRSEIDPRGIERALEHAFIVERIAPGVARLRVAGTHLSDLMGMEVRGMPLTSLFTPAARRQVSDALEEVFETPALCQFRLVSEATRGAPQMEARMILLPLKSDLGDVSRVLGCLVAQGDIGSAPRRFDVARATVQPILPGNEAQRGKAPTREISAPTHQQSQGFKTPMSGFGEAPAAFTAAPEQPTSKKRPPYLRLVKSDE